MLRVPRFSTTSNVVGPESDSTPAPHLRGLREARDKSTRDLYAFIERTSPRYEAPKHLKPLVKELQDIPRKAKRIIVSVPPRHSKSETLLHFVALLLRLHPEVRVAYCSYAQTFSETQAIKAHRYARSAGVFENPKMANRKDWQTVQGGGVFATGVGGEFTGRGADVLIIDDPIGNREQADSPTHREKVWRWFEDVAETRLEPGASVVILMTRWHEDDLTGRLLKHRPDEYTVIRLPALADGLDALGRKPGPDPLGRKVDDPLWPARYGKAALAEIREKKPYTFASLYQGLPRPRDAQVFGEPAFYTELPKRFRTVIGLDLAYSAKRRANHSAAVVYAVDGEDWYVRYVERWQGEIGSSLSRIETLHKTYAAPFRVEGNGPQKAVVSLLRDKGYSVVPVNRSADKYAEAQAYAEAWTAGRIWVPDPAVITASWVPDFLEEHRNFTGVNDPVDDQVDAAVNGFIEDNPPPSQAAQRALRAW